MSSIAFDSRKNYLKIYLQDTVEMDKPNSTDSLTGNATSTLTIPHNLGYRPMVRAWFSPDSDNTWYPMYGVRLGAFGGNALNADFRCFIQSITTTDVTFRTERGTTTTGVFNLRYKIYIDPTS